MSRKSLVLLVLLACACVLPVVPVHAQGTSVYHKTVNPAYVPLRITITFAYTTNLSNLAVSSTNQSSDSFTTNANPPISSSLVFSTGDVDVFQFGFTAYYPISVNQTVTVNVFQGSQQVEGVDEVPVSGSSFAMTFTVVTSVEPHFPSPQDIFNMWTGQYPTRNDFLAWQQLMANQNNVINSNVAVQYFVLGFIAVVFFFGELLRVWKRKPRGQQ